MLVFIIPLKSPQVSKSWEQVSKLFERTIKSVCNQTSPNFEVIVICHQKPIIEFTHPQIKYIEVEFPPPEKREIKEFRRDRGRKVLIGLKLASPFNPSHVMVVDADDCISKHLAEFVAQNHHCDGWYVSKGYEYKNGSKFLYLRTKNFDLHCGTSSILNYNFCKFPQKPETDSIESLLPYAIPHNRIRKIMKNRGANLEPLPFAGAIYVTKHGENIFLRTRNIFKALYNWREAVLVAKELSRVFKYKILTESIIEEFSLYEIK